MPKVQFFLPEIKHNRTIKVKKLRKSEFLIYFSIGYYFNNFLMPQSSPGYLDVSEKAPQQYQEDLQ